MSLDTMVDKSQYTLWSNPDGIRATEEGKRKKGK
jgi:hypothetical protein